VPLPAVTRLHVPNDPRDDALVQTALLGRVEVICTRDRHLQHPDVLTLCQANGTQIIDDVQLLKTLRALSGAS